MGVLGLLLGKLFSPFPIHRALGEVAWTGSTDFVLFAIPSFHIVGADIIKIRHCRSNL